MYTVVVFLIAVYPGNENDNLTQKERTDLAKAADTIFASCGSPQ